MPSAYVDTNIISGLAKAEFELDTLTALNTIISKSDSGQVELVTSAIVAEELAAIPHEYRAPHLLVYAGHAKIELRLSTIPTMIVAGGLGGANLVTRGMGMGPRSTLHTAIDKAIPRRTGAKKVAARTRDVDHLFQCAAAKLDWFLTEDRNSILQHRQVLAQLGIRVVSCRELAEILGVIGVRHDLKVQKEGKNRV